MHDAARPRPPHPGRRSVLTLAVLGGLALTACGAQDGGSAPSDSGKITVVTSTNVYSDLVSRVGGDTVEATPVITSGAQDPHSYEASAQDRLTVDDAQLVVVNGGGYDAFMDGMIKDGTPVLDAVQASGLQTGDDAHGDHAHHEHGHQHDDHGHAHHDEGHDGHHHHHHGGFNEHVWYDLSSMQKVADEIARSLGEIDAEHAQQYTANADALKKDLGQLQEELEATGAHGHYLATEPMPGYLLEAAGLEDSTPAEFTEAIDADADVPPAVMKSTLGLVERRDVDLVAVNQQTSTGQTDRVRATAQEKDVPVVEFSETIPDGKDYVTWMRENVRQVTESLTK